MAKKTGDVPIDETAVIANAPNLISAAIEHMTRAAAMLRSKGGQHAESCAFIAAELERRAGQLEKLNE